MSVGAGVSTGAAKAVVREQPRRGGKFARLAPGLALVVVLGLIAQGIAMVEELVLGRPWIEGLVLALLLGVLVRNVVSNLTQFEAGAAYAGKQVLEFAVVLLGAGINVAALLATGPRLAVLIVAGVTTVLVLGFLAGRLLGLGPRLALLVATGNAICGNSAIAAVAPVVKATKDEIASSIALTAVLGVTLVLTLPILIPLLSLSHYQYGVVAGMGVYAVPQVLAAAFPVSELSGEIATTVKLGRVMMLGPLVLIVGLIMAKRGAGEGTKLKLNQALPWFLIGFLVLAALRIVGLLPNVVADPAKVVGGWLTILAMAGLGLGVRLSVVRSVGPRVAVAVIVALAILISLTLTLIRVLGINA
ncbi:MAG: putative sulfate exporter family transporter [Chloroflexi bacterium]|nr:putative sulfate exporter family transporter [Chloroflexota bacterium]